VSDPISVLEAAYDLSGTEESWLSALASAARAELAAEHGLVACLYDATLPDWVTIGATVVEGVGERLAGAMFQPGTLPPVEGAALVGGFRALQVGSLLAAARSYSSIHEHYTALVASAGAADLRFVNAMDPSHQGCLLVVPVTTAGRWAPRAAEKWRRIAAHIAAGRRVRGQIAALETDGPSQPGPEAILSPDGRVEHAEDAAKNGAALSALRDAVLAFDRARGPYRYDDPDGALAMWRALVRGRWTLIDSFDSDGRRFVVARRNDPDVRDPRGLTERERQVVAYAGLGHSNKLIGYELGLSTSTVGVHLARARRKLRTLTRHTAEAPSRERSVAIEETALPTRGNARKQP
jgi:DNA-binding CsgD family transcriptional regulator